MYLAQDVFFVESIAIFTETLKTFDCSPQPVKMSDSDKYESKDPVSHTTTARVDEEIGTAGRADPLKKDLKGRHMQMIAIGMSIRRPLAHADGL